MKKLFFIMVNSEIDLTSKHYISGVAPFGYQEYTPLMDTEYLLYNGVISHIPTHIPHPNNLHSGSISPVIGTRAILKLLREQYQIQLVIVNLGLSVNPRVMHGSDFDNVAVVDVPLKQRVIGDFDGVHIEVLGIAREVVDMLDPEAEVFVAECVPGGTFTAQLFAEYCLGKSFQGSSSSSDPELLERKEVLLREFLGIQHPSKLCICDYFQEFLYYFYTMIPEGLGNKVHFCGGTQMAYPLEVFKEMTPREFVPKSYTTKWVFGPISKEWGVSRRGGALYTTWNVDFSKSQRKELQLYEQGYVKEGCGFGGMMHFYIEECRGTNEELLRAIEAEI